MTTRVALLALVLVVAGAARSPGRDGPEKRDDLKKPGATTAPGSVVSVAILDYEAVAPGNKELGSQIAEVLTARLSVLTGFVFVERTKLSELLAEHKLQLAGLVDQDQAARIGKLTGAKLLVMGKGFIMDKKLMIVTKVVGVETGQVKGVLTPVDLNKPLAGSLMLLAEDVAKLLRKEGASLLPPHEKLVDPMVELREKLADKARPDVAVVIPEAHRTRAVTDPAVETEIKKSLIFCGLGVVDTGENDLADWTRRMLKEKGQPWPPALDKAEYVIIGEAFSEFALRTGDLVTCAARAEINVIDRKTGKIVFADRATARAVDLAEAMAGKTALQKAGRSLSLAALRHFAGSLPKAAPATQPTKDSGRERP